MRRTTRDAIQSIEDYRDYLVLLVRLQLGSRLRRRWTPPTSSSRRSSKHTRIGPSSAAGLKASGWPGCGRSWPTPWRPPLAGSTPRRATPAGNARWRVNSSDLRRGWSPCWRPTRRLRAKGSVRGEELVRLAHAIARLPEDQRRVVELHYLKGLAVADVAEQIGRTRPAAVGLLFRGLKRLRELLREPGESGHGA